MKHLKLIDSDLYDFRLKVVHIIEACANVQRVLAGEWDGLSPYQIQRLEVVFEKAEELNQMLNYVKNRDAVKDISTCFDEEAA
jgi:hypothetical protein